MRGSKPSLFYLIKNNILAGVGFNKNVSWQVASLNQYFVLLLHVAQLLFVYTFCIYKWHILHWVNICLDLYTVCVSWFSPTCCWINPLLFNMTIVCLCVYID